MAVVSGRRSSRVAARGRAATLLLLALAAVLTGCGGPPRPAAAASDTDAGVGRVLDQRASAVLHHDRAAFLAGVDPQARRFQAAQRQMFDNLADVPLADWSYRLVRTGAFALPAVADGPPRTAAEVQLRYRLAGYDTQPVVSTAYLTLSRRDGRWYVAADDDGAPDGHRSAVQLWDQGPVRVVRGAHSLVLGLGATAPLREYAAEADLAVPQVRHAWGSGWPGKVVVEAPASLDQMAALLGAPPDGYRNIAAVTTGELGGAKNAPADRVIVNPSAFAGLSDFGRQVVLTHETVHVATRTATDAATPLWLSEGIADWVAYRDSGRTAREAAPELARDVAAGHAPTALPTAAAFAPTSPTLAQSYEAGWLACRLIADQWSPAALTTLYRAVARGGPLDPHFRATLGVSLPTFTSRWHAYVESELS